MLLQFSSESLHVFDGTLHDLGRFAPERPAFVPRTGEGDLAALLESVSSRRALARGQELFCQGEPALHAFRVAGGAIRLFRLLPDGRRHVVDFLVAGDYYGFFASRSFACTAQAMSGSVVLQYRRRAIEGLIERHPTIGSTLLAPATRELSSTEDRLMLLGRMTAIERLAAFLLAIARRRGGGKRSEIDLFMTRTDIADYLGLTTETVSRCMTRLRQEGIIRQANPARVVMLRREALERLAEGCGDDMDD